MSIITRNSVYSRRKGEVLLIEINSIESFNLALMSSFCTPTIGAFSDGSIDILLENRISPALSLRDILYEICDQGISFPFTPLTGDITHLAKILSSKGIRAIIDHDICMEDVIERCTALKMVELKASSRKKLAGIPDYRLK